MLCGIRAKQYILGEAQCYFEENKSCGIEHKLKANQETTDRVP